MGDGWPVCGDGGSGLCVAEFVGMAVTPLWWGCLLRGAPSGRARAPLQTVKRYRGNLQGQAQASPTC